MKAQHLRKQIYTFFPIALLGFVLLALAFPAMAESKDEGKFFGAMDTEIPAWFKDSFLDLNEDIDEASADNKRIMIFFYQHGCPYCNALVERNLAQKDIETKVKKNIDVIAINMWGDREVTYLDGNQYTEKNIAEKLRVQFTPTILFFDEKGKMILRLNGYRSPQRFNIDLDYIIDRNEGKSSYRDYVKANLPAGRTSKKLNSQDFFSTPPYDFSAKGNKPFAVFFEQKDCPNCDNLHNKVLPAPEVRKVIRDFNVSQLDMWSKTPVITPEGKKTTAREWAGKLDIKYAPSIVVFNPQGEEVIRSEAFFKVFHTQGILHYVLSEAYKKEPSFQRYLTEYADHLREKGKDVDIWRNADEKIGAGG